jgi:hypothetical protein
MPANRRVLERSEEEAKRLKALESALNLGAEFWRLEKIC